MSKKSKSQSVDSTSALSEDHTPSVDHALLKQKGDALDRFWASIEPYCADITQAEVTMLEEGIKSVKPLSLCVCLSFSLFPPPSFCTTFLF